MTTPRYPSSTPFWLYFLRIFFVFISMLQAQATDDNKKFYYTQAHPFDLMAVGMLQAFNVRQPPPPEAGDKILNGAGWGTRIPRLGMPQLLFELLIV